MCKVVGYAYEAAIHCPSCAEAWAEAKGIDLDDVDECEDNEVGVVFDSNEVEYPDNCADCHAYIDCTLLPPAIAYIVKMAWEEIHEGARSEVVAEWVDAAEWSTLTAFQSGVLQKHSSLPWRVEAQSA